MSYAYLVSDFQNAEDNEYLLAFTFLILYVCSWIFIDLLVIKCDISYAVTRYFYNHTGLLYKLYCFIPFCMAGKRNGRAF